MTSKVKELENNFNDTEDIIQILIEQIEFMRFLHGYKTFPLSRHEVDFKASAKSIHQKILENKDCSNMDVIKAIKNLIEEYVLPEEVTNVLMEYITTLRGE